MLEDTRQQRQQPLSQLVEDWPMVKRRWEAWWHGDLVDRAIIQVTAPRQAAPRSGQSPDTDSDTDSDVDPETRWTSADFMIRRTQEAIRTTYYGGEAIPWCWNPISAGHALYFGCAPHYADDTMWVDPAPLPAHGYPPLDGWRDSPAWRLARESIAAFARASHGLFFVLPFWGNHAGDIMAMVRGAEAFYMDFALNPAWVKTAVKAMSDILIEVHNALWQLAYSPETGVEGSLNYCGCWSPARTLAFDCDVSCNISPEAYREVMLPPLIESMHEVDHRIYHLDGARALNHLDTLLALPEVHAIQWVPGAGHEGVSQWIPLIQHIQSKGKEVQVTCRPEEVDLLMKQVKPAGLCINTNCETEEAARRLVERVAHRSHGRR